MQLFSIIMARRHSFHLQIIYLKSNISTIVTTPQTEGIRTPFDVPARFDGYCSQRHQKEYQAAHPWSMKAVDAFAARTQARRRVNICVALRWIVCLCWQWCFYSGEHKWLSQVELKPAGKRRTAELKFCRGKFNDLIRYNLRENILKIKIIFHIIKWISCDLKFFLQIQITVDLVPL